MQFTVKINDKDFSAAFNEIGYGITYNKVTGSNGGVTQDGTQVEDVLAWKATVNLPCIDLEETVLSELLSECMKKTVKLFYFDFAQQKDLEIGASVSIGEASFLLQDSDGVRLYTGLTVQMSEK